MPGRVEHVERSAGEWRLWAFGELNLDFLAGEVESWPWMSRRMKWEPELRFGTSASPWTPRDR